MTHDDALDLPERLAMRLYADVLDGAPLEQALGRLADVLGGGAAFTTRVFLMAEAAIPVGRFPRAGFDPATLADWVPPVTSLGQGLDRGAGPGKEVITLGHLAPAKTLDRSIVCAGRSIPVRHILSTRFPVGRDVTGIVTVQRPLEQTPFDLAEEALMTRLFPHLQRAVLAELRLADVHALSTAAGMERGQGMAVLDRRRRLHFINPTLARFMATRDGLAFGAGGLRVDDPVTQRALDTAMRQVLDTADGAARSLSDNGGIRVERTSGLAPWLIQAVPLPASRDGPFAGMAGVVLVVTDTDARAAAAQGRLRDAWGLSPAEASLAAALAGGVTLADHARKRGVSLETVRSQMASIRRKTGCRRQAELVALVGSVMRQIAIA